MNERARVISDGPYLFSVEGTAVSSYRFWYATRIKGMKGEGDPGLSQKIVEMLDKAYKEGQNDN